MLYLIIHPEIDYEMFNDGNLGSCAKELEQRIIEADSADDAITKYIGWNEGEGHSSSRLKEYFCLQVASKKCECISNKTYEKAVVREHKEKVDAEIAKELAELNRLKKKFGEK